MGIQKTLPLCGLGARAPEVTARTLDMRLDKTSSAPAAGERRHLTHASDWPCGRTSVYIAPHCSRTAGQPIGLFCLCALFYVLWFCGYFKTPPSSIVYTVSLSCEVSAVWVLELVAYTSTKSKIQKTADSPTRLNCALHINCHARLHNIQTQTPHPTTIGDK